MTPMRSNLPAGTVTFLFTDIEGSTRLLEELGEQEYAQALVEHRRLLRKAFSSYGGWEVDTQGDAFLYAFADPRKALAAAGAGRQALASGLIRVRIGLHTGEPLLTEEGYVGRELHRAARIAGAGHGGQVVLSAATRALVNGELTDLGEHRLKDFAEPIALFQLGSERFPPLKTISNTNLPRSASSFVGREREVAEVVALLRDSARLVTLTGPGGSGKTRLAIEAASELVPAFKAGVFWVGLATLRDPALVPETIAQTLGAKDGLAAHIRERDLLLLLDNLEQVVEAAPELASLIETCPNLRLLVTSRELLRVRGEIDYPVLPLADPDGVELFVTRANVEPDETVAELCRRLDNLPLALELAAARIAALSPAQILERLANRLDLLKGGRDADPRQQTLRATIEWSHDLLSPEEQELFARLAVFRGGCTLDAAEAVCDADLDSLQSLVEKSLLRFTEERYWLLETIREYAIEKLERSGNADELRRRHAELFMALAEEAEPMLNRFSREWLDRLDREHDNLRAALDHLHASGETQVALRAAGGLQRFWVMRGLFSEGRRRYEALLEADHDPTAARAKALNGAASMASNTGDQTTARRWAEDALTLYQALGDEWGAAKSTYFLGYILGEQGDLAKSQELLQESVRGFGAVGDQHQTAFVAAALASVSRRLGDLERARAIDAENLDRARSLGDIRVEALALSGLADYAVYDGRVRDALVMLKDVLQILRSLRDQTALPEELVRFGRALALEHRPVIATQVLASAAALQDETGAVSREILGIRDQALSIVRSELEDAAFAEAWEEGRTLTPDDAVALALAEIGA